MLSVLVVTVISIIFPMVIEAFISEQPAAVKRVIHSVPCSLRRYCRKGSQ